MAVVYILYVIILAAQFLLSAPSQLAHDTVVLACLFMFFIFQPQIYRSSSPLSSSIGFAPVMLFGGLLILQVLPLPSEWLSVFSPAASSVYAETIWNIDPNIWMPIAVDTRATVHGFFHLVAFFVFYLMATQISLNKSHNCLIFIVFISAVTFVAGICAQKTDSILVINDVLLAKPVTEYIIQLKDISITIIVVLSPLIYAAFNILSQKAMIPYSKKTLYLYRTSVFVLIFSVVILSGSLLIWSAVAVSIVSWGAVYIIKQGTRGQTVLLATVLVVIVLGGLFMCSSGLSSHLFWAWDNSLHINTKTSALKHPIIHGENITFFGTGIDTFDEVTFFYEPDNELSHLRPSTAWQLIVETGLIGMFLILWFFIDLLRNVSSSCKKQRNKTVTYTFAGAFASLQAYLFIATAEPYTGNSMPILYLALVLSFIASIAKTSATLPSASHAVKRSKRGWGGVILLLIFCLYYAGEFYAAMRGPLETAATADASQKIVAGTAMKNDIVWAETAVLYAPLNPLHRQSLIDICYSKGFYSKALKHSFLSLRMNPLSEETLLSTGMIFNALDENEIADLLMQTSLKVRPAAYNNHTERVNRLLSRGKKREAVLYTYYLLNNHPEKTGESLALLDLYGIPEKEKRSAIPEKSYAYWAYAKRLLTQNDNIMASAYFIQAIRLSTAEADPEPQIYLSAIDHLEHHDDQDEALNVALQGQKAFPFNAKFTYLAAKLYEQAGIKYRAIEEYRKTLFLDPGNSVAEKKIVLLQNR